MSPFSLGGMLLAGLLGISSSRVTQISTTEQITCAVLNDGALKCWGSNGHAVLARGAEQVAAEMPALVPRINLGRDASGAYRPVAAVSASPQQACAIMADDRSVKCWGDPLTHDHTLVFHPERMGNALPPVRLGPGARARSIAVNANRSCAVLEDNTVKCWGSNLLGRLGLGDEVDRFAYDESRDTLPPIDLGTDALVRSVTVGQQSICALLDQGTSRGIVKCWRGRDEVGSTPEMGDLLPRIDFGEHRHAIAVQAGLRHTCALLDDGSVQCWGDNSHGQLGIGSTESLRVPLQSVNLGRGGMTAVGIGIGADTSCAILSNQTVKCWGQTISRDEGQAALVDIGTRSGDLGDALRPINLGRGQFVQSVSAAYTHACAILPGGTVKCWGKNGNGQLGTGDRVDRFLPRHLGDALPFLNFGTNLTQVSNE